MSGKRILFFVLLIILSHVSISQTADTIISKYIAFTGGVKHWKKVRTITSSGTYNYGGIEFPFISWSKAPNLYKYVVTYNGKSFEQAYDGKNGWRIDGFNGESQKTMLTGKMATAMANESDVELESPLMGYQKKGNSIHFEGLDTVDNKPCYKIKLTRKNREVETYYFDKTSYALLKKQAIAKNTELGNSLLEILYSDYKTIEGITIPQKININADGQAFLIITLTDVRLNQPVKKNIFMF